MSDLTLARPMPEHGGALTHIEAHTMAAYLDGGLSPSDAAVVEEHLAECAACRAEVVQLERITRSRRIQRISLTVLAAAAVLVLIALPSLMRSPGAPAGAEMKAARLRALGGVAQAPVYLGVTVRAPSEQGTRSFAAGMRAYTDGRYAAAIVALRAARSGGVDGPAAPFFLGASHLMLGDATSALDEFRRVVSMGPTTYLAEAHYYVAKVLLRLDRPNEAVTALDQAIAAGNESIETIARPLRDSVRLLGAR